MKIKLITTATDIEHHGFLQLKKSANKFGWDCDVIIDNYVAYGSKMVNAYHYAKKTDCTHLFIVDAYDVVVLGTMEEAIDKMPLGSIVFNSEKACWPYSEWAKLYPPNASDWKYLNGGCAFVEVASFIRMFEDYPILDHDNDQVNLASIYLTDAKEYNFILDTECAVFQSYAFASDDDFMFCNNRLINIKTGTKPVFVHGNGKTDMTKIYELL